MSEPLPPDPYAALGVAKDVDTATVKKAHRKLVLTHHPDRISDPALKEKGKDEFTKIQQAYEILVDPVRRSRYDDQLKLEKLRKETMAFREPPRTQAYPMRPAPHSASNSREWDTDDRRFYEVRKPRNSDYSSNENFEEFNRSSSRKNPEYERPSSSRKPSESQRSDKTAKAAWGVAYAAVNFGIKVKKEAEKTRSKAHETKQEIRDRDLRKARKEKEQRTKQPFVVSEDSDSDTATRVSHMTSSTIRPSKPSSRQSREPESASRRSSGATRAQPYSGSDSDAGTYVSTNKWESHHGKAGEYIAAATGGKRPQALRQESGSYWNSPKRSGSDSDRRPTSSSGRHSYEETPTRPSMPTHTSSPANLRTRVDGGKTKERRSATGSYPTRDRERDGYFEADHRKEMPSFSRSQTMPTPPKSSSKKESSAPSKSSNLKHAETHDSGYGTSSSAHTPEMRGESPSRRHPQSSTRYQVVDPQDSDEDRQTRIHVLDDDSDHRRRGGRYTQSPEPDRRDDRRREKSDRPSMGTRSKTHRDRDGAAEPPRLRRAETSSRVDARSPRESPNVSRHNSARERLPYEVSDGEKDPRYRYPSSEKVNVRPAFNEPKYSSYGRESSDRRSHDYPASSRYQDDARRGDTHSRRPSAVQAH